jgi:hypothetical protein
VAYSPRLLGQPAKPSQIGEKLAKTWDILSPYVTGPVDAWKGLMNADLNTLLYDNGAGGRQAVEDAFNVAGTVTGGSSVVPKPANALNMGIKAYHGSPHSFDKFDMSKIGTGEGAQAYGHGLYAAESEDVSGFGGTYWNQFAQRFIDKKDPEGIATFALKTAKGDRQGAISYLEGLINKSEPNSPVGKVGKDALTMLKNDEHVGPWTYEVNIDADPNAFLDWDKPLSEQPEAVRKAIAPLITPEKLAVEGYTDPNVVKKLWKDPSGNMVYRNAPLAGKESMKTSAAEASDALRKAGIPGVKYLDAGSRGAGDGTRNYVVFDDKLISIVKKYGIAGASAMLGYNLLDGMDKAQADTLNKADLDFRYSDFLKQGGV